MKRAALAGLLAIIAFYGHAVWSGLAERHRTLGGR